MDDNITATEENKNSEVELEGDVNIPSESPAEEQTTEEAQESSVEEASDTQPEAETEGKRGASARIKELNSKAKAAEERAQSLEQKLAELTAPVGVEDTFPQYNSQDQVVGEGETVDAQEFERRVIAKADARAELRIRQSEAVNRINNEASEVQRVYPELDPSSDSFNKELSDAVTEATEAYVRSNPYNASVKTFVSKLMKPYKGAVAKEVGQASENIAKQVSQAALRPTSVRKPEKAASEKSIAELEADLGIVNS